MPNPVNLDNVAAGIGGFKIFGARWYNHAGYSVSGAGDVNGDGFDDVLVGVPDRDVQYYGAAYVVFGKADSFRVALGDIAFRGSTDGFRIIGEVDEDEAGASVSGAGDVNGDGFDDVLIGAPDNSTDSDNEFWAGAAYVVFGKADGFGTVSLGDVAAGAGGFKIIGEAANYRAGSAASGVGDINGDGLDDLLVGAPGGSAAYVVFGRAGGGAVNLDDIAAGIGGFKIVGEADGDWAGASVSAAGDVNGDGFPDLLIGASQSQNDAGGENAGAAYVVFGKAAGFSTVDLGEVTAGVGGFKIISEAKGEWWLGHSVSGAGDVNGDGFADLLIGDPSDDAGGENAGAAYVVFGKAGDFATVDLKEVATGAGGFKIIGEAADDRAGRSISGVGDVNGDGFADLLIGAEHNDAGGDDAGAAYLVFGRAAADGAVNLDDIAAGVGGFKIIGEAGSSIDPFKFSDRAGRAVSGAGDVNGDSFLDLLIGAPYAGVGHEGHGGESGAAYVVFGRGPVTHAGTGGNDRLTGTAKADVMAGDAGRDRLSGEAGHDVLDGGRGVDTLIGGQGKDQLFGGPAADWVSYAEDPGGVTVDLAAGSASDGWGDPDALAGIECVIGSQFADSFRGEGGNNVLRGLGGADYIYGDAGDNRLLGGSGNDTLQGGYGGGDELRGEAGDDELYGGVGDNYLYGGYGADALYGGPDTDHFVLTAVGESGTNAATRDVITGLEVGVDLIDLSRIDAVQGSEADDAFAFIGTKDFTAAGQVRFVTNAAKDQTIVGGDVDGDLAADFWIKLVGVHTLAAGDFLL